MKIRDKYAKMRLSSQTLLFSFQRLKIFDRMVEWIFRLEKFENMDEND